MQTLIFNTTKKTVKVYEGEEEFSKILAHFDSVPTVKVMERFYEVMQSEKTSDDEEKRFPVARFPIANTNMFLRK